MLENYNVQVFTAHCLILNFNKPGCLKEIFEGFFFKSTKKGMSFVVNISCRICFHFSVTYITCISR